jgi:hypothetical protein
MKLVVYREEAKWRRGWMVKIVAKVKMTFLVVKGGSRVIREG